MSELQESLTVRLKPDLTLIEPASARVLAWCRIQGAPAETRARIELPLVEALNNAVEHGCASAPQGEVVIVVRVTAGAVVARVTDPGHFVPPPGWDQIPEDPLAEGGRGGFIIANGTDGWGHVNDSDGHTLELRWNTVPEPGRGLVASAEADDMIEKLTVDLSSSFESLIGLSHFAGLLATSGSFGQLLGAVQERLVSIVAHRHLVIRLIEETRLIHYPVGAPVDVPAVLPLDESTAEGVCAAQRRPFVGLVSALAEGDPLRRGGTSVCLMPIEFGGQMLGTFTAVRTGGAQAFSGGEVEILQTVAEFVGIARATENLWQQRSRSLALEQEILLAANIQRSLLPAAFPMRGPWTIYGECRPAREVGGDYFDVVELADGGALMLVADVMGKGVPASLLAATLRSALRAMAETESQPEVILSRINRQLFPDLESLGMFITALLVRLPGVAGQPLRFVNAGHNAPALFRRDGSLAEPAGGDVPLGVLPDTDYRALSFATQPGDRVLLYTDGCYELPGGGSEILGAPRFLALAKARASLAPRPFVSTLLDPAALDLDPNDIADDRTLVVADLRT